MYILVFSKYLHLSLIDRLPEYYTDSPPFSLIIFMHLFNNMAPTFLIIYHACDYYYASHPEQYSYAAV